MTSLRLLLPILASASEDAASLLQLKLAKQDCTWIEFQGTKPWEHWQTRIKCEKGEHGCPEDPARLRGRYSLILEGDHIMATKKCKEMCDAKEGCIAARMNMKHKDLICSLHRARKDGPVLVLEPQKKKRPRSTHFKDCGGALPQVLDELPPMDAATLEPLGLDAQELPKFYQCGYTSYQGFKFGDGAKIPKNRIKCDPADNNSGFKCGGTNDALFDISGKAESAWESTCKALCQQNFECGAFRVNTRKGLCSLHNWKTTEESIMRENNPDSRIAWVSDCGCWKEHVDHKVFAGWKYRLKCQLDDEDYGCDERGVYDFGSDDLSVASERCKAICRKKESCTHAMLNTRLKKCHLLSAKGDEVVLIPIKKNRPRTTWAKCEAHTTVFETEPSATDVEDEFEKLDYDELDEPAAESQRSEDVTMLFKSCDQMDHRRDDWNVVANWPNGRVPAGDVNAVVPDGSCIVVDGLYDDTTNIPQLNGELILGTGAHVRLEDKFCFNVINFASSIVLNQDAVLLTNYKYQPDLHFPMVLVAGEHAEYRCASTGCHHRHSHFDGEISGEVFTLNGQRNHAFHLNTRNTVEGFLIKCFHGTYDSDCMVHANAAGSLGPGDVTMVMRGNLTEKGPALYLNVNDTISENSTLSLNGAGYMYGYHGPYRRGTNLIIAEGVVAKVRELFVNGLKMSPGRYFNSKWNDQTMTYTDFHGREQMVRCPTWPPSPEIWSQCIDPQAPFLAGAGTLVVLQ